MLPYGYERIKSYYKIAKFICTSNYNWNSIHTTYTYSTVCRHLATDDQSLMFRTAICR